MYVKLTKKKRNLKILPGKSGLQTLLSWFVINFVLVLLIIIIIFGNGERFDRDPPLPG